MSKVPHTHGQVVVICLFKTYRNRKAAPPANPQESAAHCKPILVQI